VTAPDIESLRRKTGHPDQLYGTRVVRIIDGPGDGIRAVQVWNAAGLRLEVLLDRGFDIHRVEHNGRPLHWVGPPGLRSRFAYEPQGWGWLRNFHGGLLVTCGLEHVLLPYDRKTPEYNFAVDKVDHFGLHGRVANESGELLRRELIEGGDEPRILLKGEVIQASLYSENLCLRREIEVPLFEPVIRITDVVTNRGFAKTHHEYLYHINLGYPLVDAGSTVHLATGGAPRMLTVTEPQPNFAEQVSGHQLAIDREGLALAAVWNERAGFGLELRYSAATLPYFFTWYMMGEGPYVIGLEPATVDRPTIRDPTTMSYLAPGESARYEARFTVLEEPPSG
jgi:Domain of unknown function (DUF4432)